MQATRGRKRAFSGAQGGPAFKKQRALTPRQRKQVKRMIAKAGELKWLDVSYQYQQVDRGGIITALTQVPPGTGASMRVGSALKPVLLDLRFSCYFNGGIVGSSNHVLRCVIFQWNDDATLGAPTMGNILQNTGGVGDYRAVISPVAFDSWKQKDFTLLWDRSWSIGEGSSLLAYRKKLKLKNEIVFSGATSTGTSQLYVMFLSDDATGAHTPDLQIQMYSRFLYTDS